MLEWLAENLVNIVLIAVIAGVVALLIRGMLRDKKAGKHVCGGNCACCGGCSACCGGCSACNGCKEASQADKRKKLPNGC